MPQELKKESTIDVAELKHRIPQAALAFRGYNQTNLGRSHELLQHPKYGPIVEQYLRDASQIVRRATGKPSDLVERVRKQVETDLNSWADAISLIVAIELAQLKLLEEFFEIRYEAAKVSLGFSLGEVTAAIAGGLISMEDALSIPLSMADDCIALADNAKLAVLFSRDMKLSADEVNRLCMDITLEGHGTIAVSSFLAPNSMLLIGQGKTIERFHELMREVFPKQTYLRTNQGIWPPLHTPIVWQRSLPNRGALALQTTRLNYIKPTPPVISLVTGKVSYDRLNARDLMNKWIDHPQLLWDSLYESLVMGVETYIHIGPQPNIVPATISRLRDNVEAQATANFGMRALSAAARRRWLQSMLPQRTALLRATMIVQVVLEDWLLEQQI